MTKVVLRAGEPAAEKLDVLAVLLHEGQRAPAWLSEATGGLAARALRLGDFKGKHRQMALVYGNGRAERVLLVGLGDKAGASPERVRRAVGAAVREAQRLRVKRLGLCLGEQPVKALAATWAAAAAEAAVLGDYRFLRHKTQNGDGPPPRLEVALFAERGAQASVAQALLVAEATNEARDLANEPGNVGTPTLLAEAAKKAGRAAGFKVTVLGAPEMKRLGMGALLGVAKGSDEPPRFIQMEYGPRGKAKGGTVCLVGKGLTFDSGGISIKPADNMHEMKWDKCGGCAVIGAMIAVARAKLPVRVVGLVPATENMPNGSANKPGDVLTALNGKTIEVLNTDAEGRLILADALAYSARFSPDLVVDMATLTGAVVVALGDVRAALMSNDEGLTDALRRAGEATGELIWPLPMDDAYGEHVKSEVADLKNLGKARQAGSIAGGWFLKHFVPEGTPWAHLDIAGTAWHTSEPDKSYLNKGASGFGVRLCFELVRGRCE